MKTSRFDMAESCREALCIFADSEKLEALSKVSERWSELKKRTSEAMESCDRSKEEERMDHGALLLLLCAIDDLEKHQGAESADVRSRLFMFASKKLHSARLQYERA